MPDSPIFTDNSPVPLSGRRVVLGHDYLIQMGGAERVVHSFARIFPTAPLYTSAVDPERLSKDFAGTEIHSSFISRLPKLSRYHKLLFPFYPFAFRSLGEIPADVALVSSSGFAKWLRFSQEAEVFCYCHTPPRFFWDPDDYLAREVSSSAVRRAAKAILALLRRSDYRAAQRVDHFIANSKCVQERIRQCYGRESVVIHPPVDVERFRVSRENAGYYLVVSRLVGYKRIDLAVEAFTRSGKRLVVLGDGPDRARLEKIAGPSVEFLGRRSDAEVKQRMEECYALVFPGLEDFGITPLEANACGKPVLAYGAGGALETVRPGITGGFFTALDVESLNASLPEFEATAWDPDAIRRHAESFGEQRFARELLDFMTSRLNSGREHARAPHEARA